MFQVRIHGRGGQGVVTSAELLSVAAFDEGRHAQAFPSFGSERMGAPVMAFCRIDDKPIRLREPVMEPDALIIQDSTLLHQVDVFAGFKRDGYILINTSKSFEALGLADFIKDCRPERMCAVPATDLSAQALGAAHAQRSAAGRLCGGVRAASSWSRSSWRSTTASRARWRKPTSRRPPRPTRSSDPEWPKCGGEHA